MTEDHVTILQAARGLFTKRLVLFDGKWQVEGYTAGKFSTFRSTTVSSFGELALVLEQTSQHPRLAIVRGQEAPGPKPRLQRRLCDQSRHGDAVTLLPAARRWIAIDVDSLPCPDGLDFGQDPEAGIKQAIAQLPTQFHQAHCWWQATSSAGIKPGIRCRLWFWLSRPLSDAEAKGWLQWSKHVDRSLYSAATLHYIAAPQLADGTPSPVVRRQGIRRGASCTVRVPQWIMPVEPRLVANVTLRRSRWSIQAQHDLDAALARSRLARDIWDGRRQYQDRSSADYALAVALAEAGLSPQRIADAVVRYNQRRGYGAGKCARPGYLERTVGAAMASVSA